MFAPPLNHEQEPRDLYVGKCHTFYFNVFFARYFTCTHQTTPQPEPQVSQALELHFHTAHPAQPIYRSETDFPINGLLPVTITPVPFENKAYQVAQFYCWGSVEPFPKA